MKDLLLALRFLIAPVSSWTMENKMGTCRQSMKEGGFIRCLLSLEHHRLCKCCMEKH